METEKNIYSKYCPNVFVAKSPCKLYKKGESMILTTKYGQEHECEVHNYLGKTSDGCYLYSITRVDGFNSQERAKKKAEKLNGYSTNAEKRSTTYWERSNKHSDFLSLGEPIKIGHHSERRHRKMFEDNWNNMSKSVAESEKAEDYTRRAEYWERKANDINLSMPESLSYYEFKLLEATKEHKNLKDNPNQRAHSYSLTYANKRVKEAKKNIDLAVKLWGTDEEIQLINNEKAEQAQTKANKTKGKEDLVKKYGGFFFFGSDTDAFKKKYNDILEAGHLEKGDKVQHVKAGLYLPCKNVNAFINEL